MRKSLGTLANPVTNTPHLSRSIIEPIYKQKNYPLSEPYAQREDNSKLLLQDRNNNEAYLRSA